jgi:DNA-binding response OmpR family regulator
VRRAMSMIADFGMGAHERLKMKFDFSKASVVAIDANALCLDVLTGIISGFGFRRIARHHELTPGIEHIKNHAVDLIIIDPLRFGDEAFAFVQKLRLQTSGPNVGVPVIFVTGHTSVRLLNSTRECVADYVIAKPFSTSVLLDRILWVAASNAPKVEEVDPNKLVAKDKNGAEWL